MISKRARLWILAVIVFVTTLSAILIAASLTDGAGHEPSYGVEHK